MQRGSRSVGILLSFITLLFYHFASVERLKTKKESIVCVSTVDCAVRRSQQKVHICVYVNKMVGKRKKEKNYQEPYIGTRKKKNIQRLKGNLQLAGLAKAAKHTYHERANRRISIEQIDET